MLVDTDAAVELGARLQTFMTQLIVPFLTRGYSNQAVDKLLACVGAWTEITTKLRWPYRSIPDSEAERLRPVARELLPEFFD